MQLYQRIAQVLSAYKNCKANDNKGWEVSHDETLKNLEKVLPSGSGFDCGTTVDRFKSSDKKLVLRTDYHVMNEQGSYIKWIAMRVIITPSLLHGIDIKLCGRLRNRQDLREYALDLFHDALTAECPVDV